MAPMPMQPTAQLLEQALSCSHDAVIIFEWQDGEAGARIIYVNRAFEVMTGFERDEVLGRGPGFLRGEGTEAGVEEALSRATSAQDTLDGEAWFNRRNGEAFLMAWTVTPVANSAGRITHFVVVQQDVTERRKRSRRRKDLEKVVDLQREVVAGSLDLQRVRQRVVEAAQQISGSDAAVVEEAEGDEMVYRAVAGKAEGSLGLRLAIEGSLSGLCFRKREILRSDDTREDPRVNREAAQRVGFRSGILVPLVHDRQCYGVLKVYSSQASAFSNDDQQLLEIASGILAAALFSAASFEHEVNRRSMLVDAIPILVSYIDRERRYQEVNAAYEDWFELAASDIRGKFMWEVLGEAAYETIRPQLDAALQGEEVSYEAEIPYRAAGRRTVLAQYQPHRDHEGVVAGVYAVVRDLTSVRQAELDFLTGLWNRRKFEEKADYLIRKAARNRQPLSLMLIDIDNFKAINDGHGHLVGDEVLKAVGQHLGNTVRGVDVVGRWGGEEFIILVPETGIEEAGQLAERIRGEIRRLSFDDISGVTVSIGVAEPREEGLLAPVLERADGALYRAKREGRDRVVLAS